MTNELSDAVQRLNSARLATLAGQQAASKWCKNLEGDFSAILMHLDAAIAFLSTTQASASSERVMGGIVSTPGARSGARTDAQAEVMPPCVQRASLPSETGRSDTAKEGLQTFSWLIENNNIAQVPSYYTGVDFTQDVFCAARFPTMEAAQNARSAAAALCDRNDHLYEDLIFHSKPVQHGFIAANGGSAKVPEGMVLVPRIHFIESWGGTDGKCLRCKSIWINGGKEKHKPDCWLAAPSNGKEEK